MTARKPFRPHPEAVARRRNHERNHKGSYALIVTGDSMEPVISKGDRIICCPDCLPRVGREVLVRLKDGTTAAAVLCEMPGSAGSLSMARYNPERQFEIPMTKVAAVHAVIERWLS